MDRQRSTGSGALPIAKNTHELVNARIVFQFGLGKILEMGYNDVHHSSVVPAELVHESLVGGTETVKRGEYFE